MAEAGAVMRPLSTAESLLGPLRAAGAPFRRDPNLPRVWFKDLEFARQLLGATPVGVIWVNELKGLERTSASMTYRLLVLSETRLYVTNAKVGLVSGYETSAHLYDLEKIYVLPGDRVELKFKRMILTYDDTVGPSLVAMIWALLTQHSYEVPRTALPKRNEAAVALIEDAHRLKPPPEVHPAEGFLMTYRGACDYRGVKPRQCVEKYIMAKLANARGGATTRDAKNSTNNNNDGMLPAKISPKGSPAGTPTVAVAVADARTFDLEKACRDDARKFGDLDVPAIARALAVTTHFDCVRLRGYNDKDLVLSADAARALLGALDGSQTVDTIALPQTGLTLAKMPDAAHGFPHLTELDVSGNAALGARGLAKLIGEGTRRAPKGPTRLRRLVATHCGPMKPLHLVRWEPSLRYLDLSHCVLGSPGSDALADFARGTQALETLIVSDCGLSTLQVLGSLAMSTAGSMGILKVVDVSLNKVVDDGKGCQAARVFVARCLGLERLAMAKCDLPLAALDALLEGCAMRGKMNPRRMTTTTTTTTIAGGGTSGLDDDDNDNDDDDKNKKSSGGAQNSGSGRSMGVRSRSAPVVRPAKSGRNNNNNNKVLEEDHSGSVVVKLSLFAPENPMTTKFGEVFFRRFVAAGAPPPIHLLNLDRSYMGTQALRDLFSALAQSSAPHLTVLSLKCTASKTGMFANKRNHDDMARALADVIVKCTSLEKLYLTGGEGSAFKGDLAPAMSALAMNRTLKVLDFSNNLGGDAVVEAFAGAVATNETLLKVMLDGNAPSAVALASLAHALDSNESIFDLSLPERDMVSAAKSPGDETKVRSSVTGMKKALARNLKKAQAKRREAIAAGLAILDDVDDDEFVDAQAALDQTDQRNRASSSSFLSVDDKEGSRHRQSNARDSDEWEATKDELTAVTNLLEAVPAPLAATASTATAAASQDANNNTSQQAPSNMQALLRRPSVASATDAAKEAQHRRKIFQEIFESEGNYVRDLNIICHLFLNNLEKLEICTRDELDKIFANVRELREIHQELLKKLREADRRYRDRMLKAPGPKGEERALALVSAEYAKIFATIVPFLRGYKTYCLSYMAAIEVVAQLVETRPRFAKLMNDIYKNVPNCRGLDLASFLIKPPQRLCKYPLFFRDLLKSLETEQGGLIGVQHPSTRSTADLIDQTLRRVQEVANNVNTSMAAAGSTLQVYSIFKDTFDQHEAVADLVKPSRRFLSEGEVDLCSWDKAPKRHHFFLFNDLIILATPKKSLVSNAEIPGKFKVKHRFALFDLTIADTPGPMSLNNNEHSFLVRFEDRHGGKDVPKSTSVHWQPLGSEPTRADFLVWSEDLSKGEALRAALQQATYNVKMLTSALATRRATTSSRIPSPPGGSAKSATSDDDDNDDDDEDNDDGRPSNGKHRHFEDRTSSSSRSSSSVTAKQQQQQQQQQEQQQQQQQRPASTAFGRMAAAPPAPQAMNAAARRPTSAGVAANTTAPPPAAPATKAAPRPASTALRPRSAKQQQQQQQQQQPAPVSKDADKPKPPPPPPKQPKPLAAAAAQEPPTTWGTSSLEPEKPPPPAPKLNVEPPANWGTNKSLKPDPPPPRKEPPATWGMSSLSETPVSTPEGVVHKKPPPSWGCQSLRPDPKPLDPPPPKVDRVMEL